VRASFRLRLLFLGGAGGCLGLGLAEIRLACFQAAAAWSW
jgi:hypothetical protein